MFASTFFLRRAAVSSALPTAAVATSASASVSASYSAASRLSAGPSQLASCTMPLRAKVLVPLSSRAQMSTSSQLRAAAADEWKTQPGDEPEDVLFHSLYGLRTIELNRPKKYNSLNGSMARKILPRLLEWEKSDMANVVVVKGAGDKAFCAGGDITELAQANQRGLDGQLASAAYFGLEYKLDHLIATYSKPYVAFMDGITMGGGVGLSAHAPFRIATERTVFAMPETNIGFFPDVGASFFLPRMPGAVGTYLALTSERLTGANVFYAGVATHYLHSTSLPGLEARLAELRFRDYDDMDTRLGMINATIEEFVTGLPHDQPILLAGDLRRAIDRCFGYHSVPEIVQALQAEAEADATTSSDAVRAWAVRTLKTLEHRSPTSVHVSLRQMRVGSAWSIAETFRREFSIAARFMRRPDFTEGVSSLLIRKDKGRPNWQPSTLADIQAQQTAAGAEDITEFYFKPAGTFPEDPEPLQLLNDRDYTEYPFRQLSLPSEADVEAVVRDGSLAPRQVVNLLVGQTHGKQGVKEVVEEILERKTTRDPISGKAVWQYE